MNLLLLRCKEMGHNRMRFLDRVDGHSSLRTRCRPELDATRTVISEHTHKQKEQRNRKEKRRLHPVEAQTNTQNRGMVLSSGPPRSWPARSVRPMFFWGERW